MEGSHIHAHTGHSCHRWDRNADRTTTLTSNQIKHMAVICPGTPSTRWRGSASVRLVWSGGGDWAAWRWAGLVLLLLMLAMPGHAQDCSPDSDCQPPSTSLLDHAILEANSTCGAGNGTLYKTISIYLDEEIYRCDSGQEAINQHPIEYVLDRTTGMVATDPDGENDAFVMFDNPIITTYWQSENTYLNGSLTPVSICANLTEVYLIEKVALTFVTPGVTTASENVDMRPKAMAILRRSGPGASLEYLRAFAEDCRNYFPNLFEESPDGTGTQYHATTPVCIKSYYAGDTNTHSGWEDGVQEVTFNPSVTETDFRTNMAVIDHFLASEVCIELKRPAENYELSSYYAIASLEVTGSCACYGHAAVCTSDTPSTCVCQHNTMGDHCQECDPLFNNRPWQIGAGGQANECQDCECNPPGNALSCHYDNTKGYGVCDNCEHPTTGDKCDLCVVPYYVNPALAANETIDQAAECSGFNGTLFITYTCADYCIPCNCSEVGTNPMSNYECVSITGQCTCKDHVTGRACDECKVEYWNLLASNSFGCEACDCEQAGTVNNTMTCDFDTGDCTCKANTEGSTCNACKPMYFNLSRSNSDGCTPCDCDPGGATNLLCPTSFGQCSCRSDLGGRTCRTPDATYFVPKIDYLTFDAEFAAAAAESGEVLERPGHGEQDGTVTGRGFLAIPSSSNVNILFYVPRTQQYKVILRYESLQSWTGASVSIVGVSSQQYTCGGASLDTLTTISLQANVNNPPPDQLQPASWEMGTACLYQDMEYRATVNVGNSGSTGHVFLLDSLVLLPDLSEMFVYTNGSTEGQAAMDACFTAAQPVDLALRTNLTCAPFEYSVMAELYDGAIACTCESLGSESTDNCDPQSGQCPCKAGVMLLDCSQCKVDYYNYDSGQGCTACNCNVNGSIVTACNNSGECPCQVNVTGITCDSCLPEHWGLFTGQGCQPCTCNLDYAVNNQCLDSGQCVCKPGIGGTVCDTCLDGFYGLTPDGCTDCGCDLLGSTDRVCNKETGECTCKTKVESQQCDMCAAGYFALGEFSPEGCLQCFCSGHSHNCSSAPGYFLTRAFSQWSLATEASIYPFWTGVDGEGNVVQVNDRSTFVDQTARFVLDMENTGENLGDTELYFVAPEPYLGDKRSSYSYNLMFTLGQDIPLPDGWNETINGTFVVADLPQTSGDVIIQGTHTDFKLVTSLVNLPAVNMTSYSFPILENSWKVDSPLGTAPTYVQMMQVLADVKYLYVRAKFTNVTDSKVVFYSANLPYSSTTATTTVINNVETCDCPEGYIGQFCEQCGPGFTRETPNGGPYVACVPCECNGHGIGERLCDPDNGTCDCTHNTQGQNCEACLDGYFGDPSGGTANDCSACMCPGNMVAGDVNVFASTCEMLADGRQSCINCTSGHTGLFCEECSEGFFGAPTDASNNGGDCTACFCNGRSEVPCNTTSGECISCVNNTAGQECDICAPGYFGNPLVEDCRLCNCSGATNTVFDAESGQNLWSCDYTDGQCACMPNVEGFRCDQCMQYSYNYTDGFGCHDCDCQEQGSTGRDCNRETGQCICRDHVIGRACDACEDTYWDINIATGCNTCNCMEIGTANITGETFGTCELESGQCTCERDAIIGRVCDHCAMGTLETFVFVEGIYIGEYPNCELCGQCFDNWAKKIDEVGLDLQQQRDNLMGIFGNYNNLTAEEVIPMLNETSYQLVDTEASIEQVHQMIDDLEYVSMGLLNVSAAATADGLVVDTLQAEYDDVKANLTGLTTFTGTVTLADGNRLTTASLRADAESANASLAGLYGAGNATWESIQGITASIQIASGDLNDLTTRVNTAMGSITAAQHAMFAANSSLNSDFLDLANDTALLVDLESFLDGFPAAMDATTREFSNAVAIVQEASSLSTVLDLALAATLSEWQNVSVTAQEVRFNATQALAAVRSADAATQAYLNLAQYAKGNMSAALEDVVGGIATMNNITSWMSDLETMAAEIGNVQLRTLNDMQEITNQIDQTTVSSTVVNQALQQANDGLVVADNAMNITLTAVDESYQSMELITLVENNLDQAATTQGTVRTLLTQIATRNASIAGVVKSVNNKVENANNLANIATDGMDEITARIQSIYTCLDTQEQRSQAAIVVVASVEQRAGEAQTIQAENVQTISTLTSTVSSEQSTANSNYQALLTIQTDLNQIQTNIGGISDTTELEALLNDYVVQQEEIEFLTNEVNALIAETNALISALSGAQELVCIAT